MAIVLLQVATMAAMRWAGDELAGADRRRAEAKERRLPPRMGHASEARTEEQQQSLLLVRRCVTGDSGAWEEIVALHTRRIYNLCYRFTGSPDDAQDLAQEVFIKLYRTLKSYDVSKGAFVTWVTTLTRNLLVDHYRSRKQDRVTESLDEPVDSEREGARAAERLVDLKASPEARAAQGDAQKMVHQGLQKLSPELREAVILRDLQDLDYSEIAKILRVPEGTVKSRINRGRTELARLLERTYRQVQ